MTTTLTLIRHGETEWSLSGQHTGRTDIPLTPAGEQQASSLAPRLSTTRFDHVFTSPLARARRTCDLAGLGTHAIVAPELAEWDYGDYEGQRSSELPHGWSIFRDGCPGGETPDNVAARADHLIQRLIALGGEIALFAHGHIGCALVARWIAAPIRLGENFSLATASISRMGYNAHHPDIKVILALNT